MHYMHYPSSDHVPYYVIKYSALQNLPVNVSKPLLKGINTQEMSHGVSNKTDFKNASLCIPEPIQNSHGIWIPKSLIGHHTCVPHCTPIDN